MILWIGLGFFIGVLFGFILFALMTANRDE